MDSLELRRAIRSKYAWPGLYPLALMMDDGEALCMDCARAEYRQIAYANRYGLSYGWRPVTVFINWEDSDLSCAHCGEYIESAYGA